MLTPEGRGSMNHCVGKLLLGLLAMLPVLAAAGCNSSQSPATGHSGGTGGGNHATGGALGAAGNSAASSLGTGGANSATGGASGMAGNAGAAGASGGAGSGGGMGAGGLGTSGGVTTAGGVTTTGGATPSGGVTGSAGAGGKNTEGQPRAAIWLGRHDRRGGTTPTGGRRPPAARRELEAQGPRRRGTGGRARTAQSRWEPDRRSEGQGHRAAWNVDVPLEYTGHAILQCIRGRPPCQGPGLRHSAHSIPNSLNTQTALVNTVVRHASPMASTNDRFGMGPLQRAQHRPSSPPWPRPMAPLPT